MDEDEIESVKIALLGSVGVGKTSIIVRYVDDAYNDNSLSTDGVGYSQKFMKINDKSLRLDVWDTSGQEQYRSLGKHFHKDAYIIGLAYDITKRGSFEDIKKIWYNDLNNSLKNLQYWALLVSKVIVMNKKKLVKMKEEHMRKKMGQYSN